MKRFLLMVATMFGVMFPVWGLSHSTHYGKIVVTASGSGSVYLSTSSSATSGSTSATWNCGGSSSADSKTYHLYATPASGYRFSYWQDATGNSESPRTVTVSASSKTESSPSTSTYIAVFEANPSVTITCQIPINGSYTVTTSSGTVTMTSGSTAVGSETSPDSPTLSATPASGYKFLGWYKENSDGTKTYFSRSQSTTCAFDSNVTIGADFIAQETPLFILKSDPDVYYTDLNVANTAANGSGVIVLVSNGTVPAGNYTISSGVTLLIPFDAQFSGADGNVVTTTSSVTPTRYRRLTLGDTASLTVQGTLVVAGSMYAGGGGGATAYVTGPYGEIAMGAGSQIVAENGAVLDVWGFVTESVVGQENPPSILAKSGSSVQEMFQISDWRGGNDTTLTLIPSKVFPFNQYYVQNIQTRLQFQHGASEKCETTVYMSSKIYSGSLTLVGSSSSMFLLTGAASSLTRYYNPQTNRTSYDIQGPCALSPCTVSFAGASMETSDFVLPITSNMAINIEEGGALTINNNAVLLPGVTVAIAANATMTVASGKSLYLIDAAEWGGYGLNSGNINKIATLPQGQKDSRSDPGDATITVEGTLQISGSLYTSTSHAIIQGKTGTVGQTVCGSANSGTSSVSVPTGTSGSTAISCTPAFLMNANGTFVDTASSAATFNYKEGAWNNASVVQVLVDGEYKSFTGDGCSSITEADAVAAKETELETATDGVKAWQTYVLTHDNVTDGSLRLQSTANADDGASVKVQLAQTSGQTQDSSFSVAYMLQKKGTDAWADTTDAFQSTPVFSVADSGLYRIKTKFTPASDASNAGTTIESGEIFGVMKLDPQSATTIVPVPWVGETAVLTLDRLFRACDLADGDLVRAYDPATGVYLSWSWTAADGWTANDTVASGRVVTPADAASVALPRGSALFLTRSEARKTVPFYLCGSYEANAAAPAIATGWNLLSNPNLAAFDLNNIPGGTGDKIVVPDAAGYQQKIFTKGDDGWGYTKSEKVTYTIGGKEVTGVKNTRVTTDATLAPGQGFWFVSGSTQPTIDWNGNAK